ncbi:MAG: GNAT family N-acetyltransferase [Myxococcaceae bacterium]
MNRSVVRTHEERGQETLHSACSDECGRGMSHLATFICAAGDRWLGLASGGRCDDHEGVELFSLWVTPSHRSQGIAKRLTSAIVNWARAAGDKFVWCWVAADNAAAIRLYKILNFHSTGRTKLSPPHMSGTLVLMVRPTETLD